MKTLVIAPSARAASGPPQDWKQQVLQTPGVELVGEMPSQLQVRADEGAHRAILERLGHALNIEEAAPRSFAP